VATGGTTTVNYVRITLLIVFIGVLAACGASQAATKSSPVAVQVKLSEMKIASSLTTFAIGVPYRFNVTNVGSMPHEMMLMPPAMNGGTMSTLPMEQLDTMALTHIHDSDLAPGATWSVDYTFTKQNAGMLELACYLPGHYAAGMYQKITVQ
jgi:uncharacterized cupredoxin-like copper-binding protein